MFHHLGVTSDADVISIVIQVFMAASAVMCLGAAGICRIANVYRDQAEGFTPREVLRAAGRAR